jgi:eukaryotic-like serine/threonine-protein kinase
MKFTYSSGHRPLDGYTLKRGIGRGGFGEVYFAVSDGGKEVALKLVRGNNEMELRGVAQCLNLKHPNLVALYDLRRDPQGDHWVVMEYVAGEPLSVVLARHPDGLPRELAREWFLALARAVGYLHDHGIVHRDLKPANVFLENGVVKVGDYGLSKSISTSQRTAQTQSVGTVHYMAPEISTGNYNKQIDTYAAGVILYEMLTGRVPFEGESAGEILMKHLTAPPELNRLPPEYVPIVARALAKNPAHRFATMAEMARAIEAVGEATSKPEIVPPAAPVRVNRPVEQMPLPVLPAVSLRGQIAELSGSMAMSVIFAALGTTLVAALGRMRELTDIGLTFFLTVAACWAILVPAKFWTDRRGDSWSRRVVMMLLGAALGLSALWLEGWTPSMAAAETADAKAAGGVADDGGIGPRRLPDGPLPEPSGLAEVAGTLSYFALAFFALRWWRMADRHRSQRFSFAPILAAGFWCLILLLLVQGRTWRGALALVAASAIVQLVSPWEQPPPPMAKRLRLRYA